MKPHELRYGNSVMYGGDVAEVIGIAQTYVSIKVGIYTHIVKYELLAPVPITEACLLEHGFVLIGVREYAKFPFSIYCGKHTKTFTIGTCDECGGYELEIKYLHELQNLYRDLCGEELTKKNQ